MQGAGPRYPYPKEVWTPAGGWWTRPKNWATNTFVVGVGIGIAAYGLWTYSAEREWRHQSPTHHIPSEMVCFLHMLTIQWARQFKEGELKVKEV